MTTQAMNPHVVIVGGGFGGLETARRLRKADVRITIVDRHNYHLFQPLLYQVATGGLSPANIATPLREIVRKQANCEVLLAQVTEITEDAVYLTGPDGDTVVKTDTVLWGAGVQANPLGKNFAAAIGIETDRTGHLPVTSKCQIAGHENVFVIGDVATFLDATGKPLPGLAAVAVQQGAYVAGIISQAVADVAKSSDRESVAAQHDSTNRWRDRLRDPPRQAGSFPNSHETIRLAYSPHAHDRILRDRAVVIAPRV